MVSYKIPGIGEIVVIGEDKFEFVGVAPLVQVVREGLPGFSAPGTLDVDDAADVMMEGESIDGSVGLDAYH